MINLFAIADHIWQSTLFALCAALCAMLVRRGPARFRFFVWLTASLKFVVPFSLLIALGNRFARIHSTASGPLQPQVFYQMDVASQPFSFSAIKLDSPTRPDVHLHLFTWDHIPLFLGMLWAVGVFIVLVRWAVEWLRIATILRRAQTPIAGPELATLHLLTDSDLPLRLTGALVEPGVFGIVRPVLVWPRDLTPRLSAEQMQAIMLHELEHVRRKDNATAALQMCITAVFWFHPVIWWLQSRLIAERERACDEAVLASGREAATYAESILCACEFSVTTSLACASGVTGSHIEERIRRIMSYKSFLLTRTRKMLFGALSLAAITSPIIFGVFDAPRITAAVVQDANPISNPQFDVVAIKPSQPYDQRRGLNFNPGTMTVRNLPMKDVIKFAYDLKSDSQLLGAPDWVNTERFTIEATEDEALTVSLQKLPLEDRIVVFRKLVRQMLADRFHIATSTRSTDLPIYALVVAKGGPKVKPVPPATSAETQESHGWRMHGPGIVEGSGVTMDLLANIISRMPEADERVVVDKTNLRGIYDWTLHWTPQSLMPSDNSSNAETHAAESGPTLFTALQEQLGLKLVSQKGSVEALVIDHIERPTAN